MGLIKFLQEKQSSSRRLLITLALLITAPEPVPSVESEAYSRMSSEGICCPVCSEGGRESRVLDCNHLFCTHCLEKLRKRCNPIKCPLCRRTTLVPKGLTVKHLRRQVIPTQAPKDNKSKLKVVTSWGLEGQITGVKVDNWSGSVVVASASQSLKLYGLNGHYCGKLKADRSLSLARIAIDDNRGLILATDVDSNKPAVVSLDRTGKQTSTITSSHFSHLNGIAYHPDLNVYIVADKGSRYLYYVDPRTCDVVRKIPAPGPGEFHIGMSLDCGTGGSWVSTDWGTGIVRLWDREGACLRAWNSRGKGFGQFDHPAGVAASPSGRFLVSDATNQRLVWLSAPSPLPTSGNLSPGADSGIGSGIDSSGSGEKCSPYATFGKESSSSNVCEWLDQVWPEVDTTRQQGPGEVGDWQEVGGTSGLGLGVPRDIDVTDDGLVVASMWNSKHGPFNVAVLKGADSH